MFYTSLIRKCLTQYRECLQSGTEVIKIGRDFPLNISGRLLYNKGSDSHFNIAL